MHFAHKTNNFDDFIKIEKSREIFQEDLFLNCSISIYNQLQHSLGKIKKGIFLKKIFNNNEKV